MTEHEIQGFRFDLREMTGDDGEVILAFARALPEHDRLFLRRDITTPEEVERWCKAVENGRVTTLLAIQDGTMLGYATVDRSGEPWTQHVAELRVVVGVEARGKGLGRFLTEQAFRAALEGGVDKLVARMTLDQQGAIAVFENLGFRPEGLLKEHVVDQDGTKHDLLVLAHSVAEFEANRSGFGVAEALGSAG